MGMYKVAERRETEVRQEVKKKFEEDRKKLAQKKRRAARADRRVTPLSTDADERLQENLFMIGLRNDCPRCGWHVSPGDGREETSQHLDECTDLAAIAAHKKAEEKRRRLEQEKANGKENEADIMALKRWELNGRQVGQLWMLSDANLKRQCETHKLSTDGKRHEIISRLAKHLRDSARLMLTYDGGSEDVANTEVNKYDTATLAQVDEEDLPENIEGMDREELQDLCASYAVEFDANKDAKMNLIKRFEAIRDRSRGQLMLCESKDEIGTKKKRKKAAISDDEDGEYVPSD